MRTAKTKKNEINLPHTRCLINEEQNPLGVNNFVTGGSKIQIPLKIAHNPMLIEN